MKDVDFYLQGINWEYLRMHGPGDSLEPRAYHVGVPPEARVSGVQLRWWQPVNRGEGRDQWAIDQIEISRYVQEMCCFSGTYVKYIEV